MNENNKLTPMQDYMAEKIASFVARSLFGDDYKKYKFSERLQKALDNSENAICYGVSWVFVIYGLLYIGQVKIVEIVSGLYLGFFIFMRILFISIGACTEAETPVDTAPGAQE